MNQIVNIDGKFYAPEEASISVFDHGFLFGDSIYETMRTYKRKLFLIDRHLSRLENSARMIHLKLPLSIPEIRAEIERTIQATDNSECYIRMIITRGTGEIGLDIDFCKKQNYVIIVRPFERLPDSMYRDGVKVALVQIRRNDLQSLDPNMKTCNLLNNVLAYKEAKDQKAFDGILCNIAGFITEATASNVFAVKSNVLLTPPPEAGLLQGVTRWLILDLARKNGIATEERNITPREILGAEECFITSTTKGILPVNQINDVKLESVPGPLTKRLMEIYDRFVSENYLTAGS
jgi:branched-chain amino acid aminotransferase